jgi:glycosyltransferase involved in cell wall biosynthesis
MNQHAVSSRAPARAAAQRILIVSPVPTHPPSAGNRARVAVLAQGLEALGHQVRFAHVERERGDPDLMRAYWGDRYLPIPYQPPVVGRVRRLARRAARKLGWGWGYRYGIDEWYDPGVDAWLDAIIRSFPVDTVVVEYAFMTRALLRLPDGVLKVLDTHDILSDRHRRYLEKGETPRWFSCSKRQEAKAFARADVVVAIQDEEAACIRHRTASPVTTVGHAVPTRRLSTAGIVTGRVLLIGSQNPINVAGYRWLIERVWPRVLQATPHARLAVAGSLCERLSSQAGVELLGRFDDVADAYAGAQVVVNPSQLGTGLKVKTIEALAHGRPVVATPSGAEGLSGASNAGLLVAAEPAHFASEVVQLLRQRERTDELADAAIAYVNDYNRTVRCNLTALLATCAQTSG